MSITLYGATLSPFVRKIRIFLAEKGLDYEHVQIDPFNKPADYENMSPFGRIPALKDGDKTLADSAVICSYLEEKYPGPPLYPSDPYLKARTLWFEKFGDYELAPQTTFRVFRNRVVMRLIGQTPDESVVEEALESQIPPLLDYLEKELGDTPYIVGNQFSVADIAIATQFICFALGGEFVNQTRWPRSANYLQCLFDRSSIQPLYQNELSFVNKVLG